MEPETTTAPPRPPKTRAMKVAEISGYILGGALWLGLVVTWPDWGIDLIHLLARVVFTLPMPL